MIIILGTILILIPIQKKIDKRILEVKTQTISILEKYLNRKVTYSSISPSIFMYMEFRNLALHENDRELININRIRIYYSLKDLLSGKVLSSLKEIRIIKSTFSFDFKEDKDLLNLFSNISGKTSETLNIPDIKITGKNLKIKLIKSKNIIDIKKLFFTLEHREGITQFTSKGFLHTLFSKSKYLSGNANFSVLGTLKDNYELSNTLLVLKSLENDFIISDKISLRASYKSNQFSLQKVEDSRPLDIRLNYSIDDRLLKVNFDSENFIPLDYFEPKKIDYSILQWLGTSITGSGELCYIPDTEGLTYSANITANTNNSSIPNQAVVTSSLNGNNFNINFSKLKIETSDGKIVFKGNVNYKNFLPTGTLFIFYNHPLSQIKADLVLDHQNNKLNITANNIFINNIELYNFKTSVDIFEKDFDFKISLNLEDLKDLPEEQISIDGNIQYKPDIFLNLSLSTVNIPINSFLKNIPLGISKYLNTLPNLFLNSDLFISTDLKQFSFSAKKIQINSNNGDNIKFSAFGNNESIDINNISAEWGKKNLKGSIITKITKRSVNNIVKIQYEENDYSANILYYPDKGLFFNGNHGLLGSWYKSGNISEYRLSFKDFPIPIGGNTTSISLETNGTYTNLNNWKANIDNVNILNIPGMISGSNLSISGELTDNTINLSSIQYSDTISELMGHGFFEHNIFVNHNLNGNFQISSNDGEQYTGFINLEDNNIDLKTDFTKASLDRFNKTPVSGLVNGNITLTGILPKPNIKVALQLEKGEFNSSPLEIETSLEISEDKFQLSYLRIKYKNQTLQKGNGEFNVKTGDFLMSLEYRGIIQDKNLQSFIDLKGKSELFSKKPSIYNIFNSNYESNIVFSNILVNNQKSDSWDFQINRNDQKTSISGGPEKGLSGFIDNAGNFNFISGNGLPLRGKAEGVIADSIIDMEIIDMEIDLTLLNFIPYGDFLEFKSGTGYGSLKIKGQITNPIFDGSIHVEGAKADVYMVPEEIDIFSTEITIKERTMKIGPEILNIHNSSVKIGMELTINNWIPDTFSLNIETLNQDRFRIIYDVPYIGLGIDGYVNGGFNLSMDEYGLHITGNLLAEECIIILGTMSNDNTGSDVNLLVNMLFTTGKKVQFIWPSNTLPILKATAEQGQVIKLNMDNFNETFSLKGDVNIKYGEIYYFQKSFYLAEGSINFDETQSKFDPSLGFEAQIKEIDADGNIVNISLIQDKKPVSQFAPRFESDPPLSDVEIFSILGAGVFAEIGSEQIDLTSALVLTGDLVTQFAIIRNFEKKVKNIFNLDLFSIRTQMIQNILIDKFVHDGTAEQEVYLDSFGRYLDNTTLYLGKYIGDDIFLQALLQINNQQFIDTDLYATNKLLIESTISLEWQTPLFLLGFSVKPDFVDPISSIQNTSLELSWGYSY